MTNTPVDPPPGPPPPSEEPLPWAIQPSHTAGRQPGHAKAVAVCALGVLLVAVLISWYIADSPRRQAQAAFPNNPAAAANYEWTLDGGNDHALAIHDVAVSLGDARTAYELRQNCDQLFRVTTEATKYRPIPDKTAQMYWSQALWWTQHMALACSEAATTGRYWSGAAKMRDYANESIAANRKMGARFAEVRQGG